MTDAKNIIDITSIIVPFLIINALTITVGLSWNDSINSFIDNYFVVENDERTKTWYKLYATIVLTVIFVILLVVYSKIIRVDPKTFIQSKVMH